MSDQEKCPACHGTRKEVGIIDNPDEVLGHIIGGEACLRRQLAASDAELAQAKARIAELTEKVTGLQGLSIVNEGIIAKLEAENARLRGIVERLLAQLEHDATTLVHAATTAERVQPGNAVHLCRGIAGMCGCEANNARSAAEAARRGKP